MSPNIKCLKIKHVKKQMYPQIKYGIIINVPILIVLTILRFQNRKCLKPKYI